MKTATIISDAHPREDPRTQFWASSLVEVGFETNSEILRGRGVPRHKRKEAAGKHLSETPLTEHSISASTTTNLLNQLQGSGSEPVNALIKQLRLQDLSRASIGHKQLVNRCLSMAALGVALSRRSHDLILGLDLQGAVGAIVCQSLGIDDISTVYDAQEVVVAGIPNLSPSEIEFWLNFETRVGDLVTSTVTVSPGIAKWYRSRLDLATSVLPNFEPISFDSFLDQSVREKVKFVYFGGCDRVKGLDLLVDCWPDVDFAELHIIAKQSPDRDRIESIAKSRGLFNRRVFFSSLNDSTVVVSFLRQFDVGIVPYQMEYPYSEASPNKFGQYLAAGLPVVTPRTGFVSDLVEKENLGVVVPFFSVLSTRDVVNQFSKRDFLNHVKQTVNMKFHKDLNWNVYFRDWYERTETLLLPPITESFGTEKNGSTLNTVIPRRSLSNACQDLLLALTDKLVQMSSSKKLTQKLKNQLEKSDSLRAVIEAILRKVT